MPRLRNAADRLRPPRLSTGHASSTLYRTIPLRLPTTIPPAPGYTTRRLTLLPDEARIRSRRRRDETPHVGVARVTATRRSATDRAACRASRSSPGPNRSASWSCSTRWAPLPSRRRIWRCSACSPTWRRWRSSSRARSRASPRSSDRRCSRWGGPPGGRRGELTRAAHQFARHLEEDGAFEQALEIARLIRTIVAQGEDASRAVRTFLRGFAECCQSSTRSAGLGNSP